MLYLCNRRPFNIVAAFVRFGVLKKSGCESESESART